MRNIRGELLNNETLFKTEQTLNKIGQLKELQNAGKQLFLWAFGVVLLCKLYNPLITVDYDIKLSYNFKYHLSKLYHLIKLFQLIRVNVGCQYTLEELGVEVKERYAHMHLPMQNHAMECCPPSLQKIAKSYFEARSRMPPQAWPTFLEQILTPLFTLSPWNKPALPNVAAKYDLHTIQNKESVPWPQVQKQNQTKIE